MFTKVNFKNLVDIVYDEIKEKILSNELKPGEKLSVEMLSEQLGVSRTPISNALKALERDGYVVIRPRSGTFVKGLSSEELEYIFDLREAIEEVIVRKGFSKLNKKAMMIFRQRFKAFASLSDQRRQRDEILSEYFDLEVEFHEYLISYCLPIAYNDIHNMIDLTKRARKANLENLGENAEENCIQTSEIQIHMAIIDSIIAGNLEDTLQLLREDIQDTKERILAQYQQ